MAVKRWEDCPREDLNMIPKMIERGWEPKFSTPDSRHGRTVPDNCPHDSVSFVKGNTHAWKVIRKTEDGAFTAWKVADLLNEYFCNHRDYDSLDDVLEKEG